MVKWLSYHKVFLHLSPHWFPSIHSCVPEVFDYWTVIRILRSHISSWTPHISEWLVLVHDSNSSDNSSGCLQSSLFERHCCDLCLCVHVVCVYIDVYMHTYTYISVYDTDVVYVCVYMLCMYLYLYTGMYLWTRVYMYLCMCVWAHAYKHTHTFGRCSME